MNDSESAEPVLGVESEPEAANANKSKRWGDRPFEPTRSSEFTVEAQQHVVGCESQIFPGAPCSCVARPLGEEGLRQAVAVRSFYGGTRMMDLEALKRKAWEQREILNEWEPQPAKPSWNVGFNDAVRELQRKMEQQTVTDLGEDVAMSSDGERMKIYFDDAVLHLSNTDARQFAETIIHVVDTYGNKAGEAPPVVSPTEERC